MSFPSISGPAVDAGGVDQVLMGVVLRAVSQRRISASERITLPVPQHGLSIINVLRGSVSLTDAAPDPAALGRPNVFDAGDALFLAGTRPPRLIAAAGSELLLSHFALEHDTLQVATALPRLAWVTGFTVREPGAAALAEHMGLRHQNCGERAGDTAICQTMATALVLSVIRAWIETGCAPAGWPSPTGDLHLDRAVRAVREDPSQDWSVQRLACIAAMSRSVFAARFRTAVKQSPAQYVAEVKMHAARELLRHGHAVSDVSRRVGYDSDEGFSRAFRRHSGQAPSAWRAAHAILA